MHITKESVDMAKDECNAELVIIPGGCTSIVQPMDKCINHPFKQRVREHWQEWTRQDRPKTLWESETANMTRSHRLGVSGLDFNQERHSSALLGLESQMH